LEISFPVFKLPGGRPLEEAGVLYYVQEYRNTETDDLQSTTAVVDNKNIAGDSLSLRRLKLATQGTRLYRINLAVYFLGDLIKLAKSKTWWIDSQGKLFEYKKTTGAKLKFYRLEKCFTTQGMGAVIQVCGLPQRFKTMFIPTQQDTWCGILEWNNIKIFYGFYAEQHKETWRMI
jgi:hypothetical protein